MSHYKEKQREYQQKNKEDRNARIRKRRKNDPEYNLICRLRCRIGKAVKAAGLDKKSNPPNFRCQVHKTTVNSCHGQSCDKDM